MKFEDRRLLLLPLVVAAVCLTVFLLPDDDRPSLAALTAEQEEERQQTPSMLILAPHAEQREAQKAPPGLVGREKARPRPRRKLRAALSALARAGGLMESLEALGDVRHAVGADASLLPALERALAEATSPVARQNIIFHVALSVPAEEALPWLTALSAGSGPDADDAGLALACLGDGPAVATQLARMQPESTVTGAAFDWSGIRHIYQHEALGKRGDAEARVLLRPYRAVEVLRGSPYFHRTGYSVPVVWRPSDPPPPETLIKVLKGWLQRYAGHPGTDDVALYIARAHVAQGRFKQAARWFAQSAAYPDGDAGEESLRGFLGCVELFLEPHQLGDLLVGVEQARRIEDLLTYIRIRRIAAEGDLGRAVREFEYEAMREPDGFFGVAFAASAHQPTPRGLTSGVHPLARSDPLLAPRPGRSAIWSNGPSPDWQAAAGMQRGAYPLNRVRAGSSGPVMLPDVGETARQLRVWQVLDELEQRVARASSEDEADLLYKVAAVHFHNPRAFFPAYAKRGQFFRELLGRWEIGYLLEDYDRWWGPFMEREAGFHGEIRAIAIFEEIESRHGRYEAMDRVVLSRGQALRRLVAAWPSYTRRDDAKAAIVPLFERFTRDFPRSPLMREAQAALHYWRQISTRR